MTIDDPARSRLVKAFEQVKDVFPNENSMVEMLVVNGGKMPMNHFLLVQRIKRADFAHMSDVDLVMLCGMCKFVFSAGDFGYSASQNMALNTLDDEIYELKNSAR